MESRGCRSCSTNCMEGSQNGDETDVNCGGSCPLCGYHWAVLSSQQSLIGSKPRTCLSDGATSAPRTNQWGNTMAATCCDDLTSNIASQPGCLEAVSFSAAELHSQYYSMVLCSVAQLEAGAGTGAGCAFNASLVWTRDTSPTPLKGGLPPYVHHKRGRGESCVIAQNGAHHAPIPTWSGRNVPSWCPLCVVEGGEAAQIQLSEHAQLHGPISH